MLPQKLACLRRQIAAHLEDLPGYVNQCVGDLLAHADPLDTRIEHYDRLIARAARENARSRPLTRLPGIGPNTASALLASLGVGHDFNNGWQVAAWIGLTPGQYSSGGRAQLGRITKAGDRYLRSLLVMGARAVLSGLGEKQDRFSGWAGCLLERRGYRVRWWRSPQRMHAWRGRCSSTASNFG